MQPLDIPTPKVSDSQSAASERPRGAMCSLSLMKSGCPSCLLIGAAILPLEAAGRAIARARARRAVRVAARFGDHRPRA